MVRSQSKFHGINFELFLGSDKLSEVFSRFDSSRLRASEHFSRLKEQTNLINSNKDLESLKRAMESFTFLQHVKILRVQDEAERELLQHNLRHRSESRLDIIDLDWEPACTRAVRTISQAILASQSPVSRFSGPQINPLAAVNLKTVPKTSLQTLASNMTCLEIHFDSLDDIDIHMQELKGVFCTLFQAAKNMEFIHLGFSSRWPLDLKLEDVFHHIQWEKLRAFGIQSWCLHGDEILDFALRHRKTLRGLRLRDVLLREGSKWCTVLSVLRDQMHNLEWVSLRRIDYVQNQSIRQTGINVLDGTGSLSPSDSEDEVIDELEAQATAAAAADILGPLAQQEPDGDDTPSIGEESDSLSSNNGEDGPSGHQIGISPETGILPNTSQSRRWLDLSSLSADDLCDSGVYVDSRLRKIWEEWVVSKPRHDYVTK